MEIYNLKNILPSAILRQLNTCGKYLISDFRGEGSGIYCFDLKKKNCLLKKMNKIFVCADTSNPIYGAKFSSFGYLIRLFTKFCTYYKKTTNIILFWFVGSVWKLWLNTDQY